MDHLIVFIYLPGQTEAVPAGRFSYDPEATVGLFEYGQQYLRRSDALAVDPISLPLGRTPLPTSLNDGVYGCLRDAAPDHWGRMVIARELHSAPEALSELDFLLASNATRVGNLDFRRSPDSPEPTAEPPHFHNLGDILVAATEVESGRPDDSGLIHLLQQGSSMGGARPKCTVQWDGDLWLAKFAARNDTLNIPIVEYATMTLAAACGITVPEVKQVAVQGQDVFLVRRFDRKRDDNAFLRTGFLSALSLMQWDQRGWETWDYTQLTAGMRQFCGQADMTELFRRMIFNILIRNTDDHPRNHGFLWDASGCKLSPVYDLVPTICHRGVGFEFNLAMAVGTAGKRATLENAKSRAGQFGLSQDEATTHITDLSQAVSPWTDVFNENGVSDKDIDLLAPSFSTPRI